jgi:hypothetical protein
MALYSVDTKRSREQIMARAKDFFGAPGLGLEMEERGDACLYFSGGGGHVQVTVLECEGKTTVELETREWDYQVQQFMPKIH